MATVADLIKQLCEIEDQSQTVVFQYYLAEDFLIDVDGEDVEPCEEMFSEAVEQVEDYIWDGCWDILAENVANLNNLRQVS